MWCFRPLSEKTGVLLSVCLSAVCLSVCLSVPQATNRNFQGAIFRCGPSEGVGKSSPNRRSEGLSVSLSATKDGQVRNVARRSGV